jgi:hypothetical protein
MRKWPKEFDSIVIAPCNYQRFKTLPERAAPEVAAKLAGINIISNPFMPETGAAIMHRGKLVGWIEFVKENPP